jgi:hypothetical protein
MSFKHLSLFVGLALTVLLLLVPGGLAEGPTGDDSGL